MKVLRQKDKLTQRVTTVIFQAQCFQEERILDLLIRSVSSPSVTVVKFPDGLTQRYRYRYDDDGPSKVEELPQ